MEITLTMKKVGDFWTSLYSGAYNDFFGRQLPAIPFSITSMKNLYNIFHEIRKPAELAEKFTRLEKLLIEFYDPHDIPLPVIYNNFFYALINLHKMEERDSFFATRMDCFETKVYEVEDGVKGIVLPKDIINTIIDFTPVLIDDHFFTYYMKDATIERNSFGMMECTKITIERLNLIEERGRMVHTKVFTYFFEFFNFLRPKD